MFADRMLADSVDSESTGGAALADGIDRRPEGVLGSTNRHRTGQYVMGVRDWADAGVLILYFYWVARRGCQHYYHSMAASLSDKIYM